MRSICTSIVATLVLVGTSFAATINVPGDYSTIQGAINVSSDGDTIAIAAGTYNEHSLNPSGKAITIGSASGNLDVTIDAQQNESVFVIVSSEDEGTVIKDLIMTGGLSAYGVGGGIRCHDSNPTITNCTIENNTASGGGGGILCHYSSNPTISNCTIEGNTANGYGGGIFCYYDSSPTISGSQLCGNEPDQIDGGYADGGGNTVADECPDSEGACCVTSGCTALYETQCAEMGGTWLGDDASCDDCPATCAGDTDGNGVVNIEDLLNMLGSWGACP